MPRKNTHDIVPEGCFDVDKEMKWYSSYYKGEAMPLLEKEPFPAPKKYVRNGKEIAVNKMSLDGVVLQSYESVKAAAVDNNISSGMISLVLNGHNMTAAGFKWSYKL